MPTRLRLLLTGMTGALLVIPLATLYRELSRPADIWWTPMAMALAPAASADRIEIYVRGKPLNQLLVARQLWIGEQGAASPIGAEEIRVRFNNWDRFRAGEIPLLLSSAAACGAGFVLLLLILTGRLAYRGERAMSDYSAGN
jgi:hypothetical protein